MGSTARLRFQITDLLERTVQWLEEAEYRISEENAVRKELKKARERLAEAEAASLSGPRGGGEEVGHLMSCLHWIVAVSDDLELGIKEAGLRRTLEAAKKLREITKLPDQSITILPKLECILEERRKLLEREPRLALRVN